MFNELEKTFELQEVNVAEYSPLTLAFMGDCVYEFIIRTKLIYRGNAPVNTLNKKSSALAKAQTQAKMIEGLFESLSEEEQAAYKRGRNANSHSKAKNATTGEYRKATGFESLLGYLYLKKDFDRIMEIVKKGFEIIEGEKV
jgi:ribonuclease-3 family protein